MTFFPSGFNMVYAWDLENAATVVAAHEELMAHWRRTFEVMAATEAGGATEPAEEGSAIMVDVVYEDLVADPRSVLEPLLDYLGLKVSAGGDGDDEGMEQQGQGQGQGGLPTLDSFLRFYSSSRA